MHLDWFNSVICKRIADRLNAGNTGKNSNTSQFFFTLDALPKLNGKHVIFGEILAGFDILEVRRS